MSYTIGSPGITIKEEDLATFVSPVSITTAATVCNLEWGPCEPTLLSNEDQLLSNFGKPTDENYKDWFSARNFLNYSSALYIYRTVNESSKNASDVSGEARQIKTSDVFTSIEGELAGADKNAKIFARYPGTKGNSFKVVISDKATVESEGSELKPYVNELLDNDSVVYGVFENGILVEFAIYSFNKTAVDAAGNSAYLPKAINKYSRYIYVVESKLITYTDEVRNVVNVNTPLQGGTLVAPLDSDYVTSWNAFKDTTVYNVSLLIQAGASSAVGKHIVDNVAGYRKDAIACLSPQASDIVNLQNFEILQNLATVSNLYGYSSYRFMDGNYKYQYDSYNDTYRWVPFNADVAGAFALTDIEKAPWFSPGGTQIKDTIKLAWTPDKADRDEMYMYRINPITSFAETGVVLWGDFTGAATNTSFNYVNIRRLFIYIEKSIGAYARSAMWKNNTTVVQTSFFQNVDPFLRTIKGNQGIDDYKIICDDTVNTPDVKMQGKFIAKIYIKPVYSIRFIEITFISTRSDVSFEEIAQS